MDAPNDVSQQVSYFKGVDTTLQNLLQENIVVAGSLKVFSLTVRTREEVPH